LIKKFYELNYIHDIPGIYRLPFEKVKGLGGFGEKSITNLAAAIEKSKQQPLHRLIFALGIRYVGETTAKVLAGAVRHITDFNRLSVEDLLQLEDVGPKVAGSIYQFFHNEDNLSMLVELESLGLTMVNTTTNDHKGGNLE